MTATGHAILGVSLAATISEPIIGIPLAIISHVAADAFPHWDTGTNMRKKSKEEFMIGSFIDVGFSLILPYFLFHYLFPSVSLVYGYTTVIAAQGLDWATAPYVFLKWQFPPFTWVYNLQKSFDHRLDKPWGIITQVSILLLFLILAYIL